MPCLLTDQNFKNNSDQNLTNSFREDFLGICLCPHSKVAPIHQSHVHGQVKISLTISKRGHSEHFCELGIRSHLLCCAYRFGLTSELNE